MSKALQVQEKIRGETLNREESVDLRSRCSKIKIRPRGEGLTKPLHAGCLDGLQVP